MQRMYIGGELITAPERLVVSPATGEAVGSVAWADAQHADLALESARDALPAWAAAGVPGRIEWMRRLRDAVVDEEDRLRRLVADETGKTMAQTEEDYQSLVDALTFYADEIELFLRPSDLPDRAGGHTHRLSYQPVGVAVAFIAWNFPLLNLAFKIGPAMAAGCPIVIKPSVKTPLAAYAVGELCHQIGLPPGVVSILCGDDQIVGDTLSASTIPALVTLIGSTATGRHVMRNGATSVKRYSMELGGNAPALVFPDADLDLAAQTVAAVKFGNAGQVCVAPNRVFVHEDIAERFLEQVVERAGSLKVGPGPDADMGPLIDKGARDRVAGLVSDAINGGARRLTDTELAPPIPPTGTWYPPTVLDKITPTMRISREEIFGPVVAVQRFRDRDDILAAANDTDAGLTAYVFTQDPRLAATCADQLRFGEIQINGVAYDISLPHGGIKQSGVGHDCSTLALHDYLAIKRTSQAVSA